MLKHFQQIVGKSNKTPQDNIGVSATGSSQQEQPKKGGELEFRVDWFQGTFNSKYLAKVQKIVSVAFGGGEFVERATGIRYFAKSYKHPSGAVSGVGQKIPGGLVNESLGYLELSGSVLMKIKQRRLRKLMRVLRRKYQFKCTHNDLTIDDFGRSFLIEEVKQAYDENNFVGFRETGDYREIGRRGSKGKMMSFGRRGSAGGGKRIVFYDKCLESDGKIDSIRIELATYGIYAQQSFEQLCDLPYLCWGDLIGGWISGAIDFVERKGEKDKNPGRRKRLEWWANLVDRFPKLKPSREYKPDTLEKVKAWFVKQVAPSLAVLLYAMNNPESEDVDGEFWNFFWDAVYDGESRFREKHWYLINSC